MELSERYARWLVQRPWLALLLPIALCVAAASGVQHLRPSGDYRVFFGPDNPQLIAFEEMQDVYTKIDNVLFAVQPLDGDVFTPEAFAAIEALTERAWTLPFAIRVDSLSNFQHTRAEEDELIVEDLIRGGGSYSPRRVEEVRGIARAEPAIFGRLIPPAENATGVDVTVQLPGEALSEITDVVTAAEEVAAAIEAEHPVRIKLSGVVMLNNAFNAASLQDLRTLVPWMYVLILLAVFLLVRSLVATLAAAAVTFLSILSAMGLAGWAGMLITAPSSAAPAIIATLAVADSVHFLISMFAARAAGMERTEAVIESLRVNLSPIFLTSITTAIGFLSMNFSDAPPLRHLGNTSAVGVMFAFGFSVTLLPAVMSLLPSRGSAGSGAAVALLDRLAEVVVTRHRLVLVTTTLIAAVSLVFIPRNQLRDDFVNYFHPSLEFRQAADFTNENLTGLYQLQYSLAAGGANGVADPAFLADLDRFAAWLREQPEVRHVNTISDTFKRLNKSLHGDDPAEYRLPEQADVAAQYLLLYEMSLPYGLDLNNQLDVDKSATQVVVTLSDLPSVELRQVAERGERWLREHLDLDTVGAGPAIMFAHIADRTIGSMVLGTSLALVAISAILLLALRSVSLGLTSLIPNLLPGGIAFGLWGLTVAEINIGTSIVLGMTLGIVVDDTVHFLSKYLRAKREHGARAADAVRYAVRSVGMAILFTSVILIAGFGVLSFSVFGMNELMSKLTMVTIVMALFTDFLLLPALLVTLDRRAPTPAAPPRPAGPPR